MSSNLHWRPVIESEKMLGSDLKFALRAKQGGGYVEEMEFGSGSIPWLQGIVDSNGQGADEAKKLIGLIYKHGRVIVWESS